MIDFNKLWKNRRVNKKRKREIQELNFEEIDLKKYTIIDVRSRREFREDHLNGSINVPLPDVKRNIEKYVQDKNKKVLVCCQSGIRSAKAVEVMENMGYTNVYNLKGGLENI